MRYAINFDKVVNQLIPYYLAGRTLILYLQSLLKPLQIINDEFVKYAKETRIEASMTSQPIKMEWYLNRKFSKYFAHGGKISLTNGVQHGVPIYYERAGISQQDHMVLYNESDGKKGTALYKQDERTNGSSYSFSVSSPAIDTSLISQDKYIAMLSYYIDKYKLFGKSYIINFNA